MYFRVMLIGFFEGIESERGIAWRVADSLCLRQFLRIGLDERTPDHVTISRTRRLLDKDTHQKVFGWVLRQVTRAGLLRGKTIGIDATSLEASAAMKSIVRRDTEESYTEYLKRFAHAYETGALRRLYVRGKQNVQKRLLLQAAACNLALLLRKMMGAGTPRALHDIVAHLFFVLLRLISSNQRDPGTSRSLSVCMSRRIPHRGRCVRRKTPRQKSPI